MSRDNDLVKTELERVYGLYSDRFKSFRRGLYGLIGVGLTLFLLVVVPFLTLRGQIAQLKIRAAKETQELAAVRDLVAATSKGLEILDEMHEGIYLFTERHTEIEYYEDLAEEAAQHDLRVLDLKRRYSNREELGPWIRGETQRPPDDFIRSNRQVWGMDNQPCPWSLGTLQVACRLCRDAREAHGRWSWRLGRLQAFDGSARDAARQELEAIVEGSCARLTGEAPQTTDGEPLEADDDPVDMLRGDLARELFAYRDRFETYLDSARSLLPERRSETDRLAAVLATTNDRLETLESQLERVSSIDRLGTPVGELPLGLGQIVLLFPVGLSFAFVVVALSYLRVADLRREFSRLCRKSDAPGAVLDERHVEVIAPLWFHRATESRGSQIKALQWAVVLTPLALMVTNLLLIWRTQALTAQFPDDAVISPTAYLILYLIALSMFGIAISRIWWVDGGGPEGPEPEPQGNDGEDDPRS